ncbi:MAG: hypothetical protein LBS54_03870 [Dysgonamonadaceae bacterium]|nr:hypothetical protein [Dysgonamonadaceae bacterium]
MAKLIANALFIVLGTIVLLGGGDPIFAVVVIALGGIPTAWKLFSPSKEEKWENKIDDAVAEYKGTGSGFFNSIIRFFIRVLFTVVVGAIAAPILLIVNIVKFVKCNNRIKGYEDELANFADI